VSAWLDALATDVAQDQIAALLARDHAARGPADEPRTVGPWLNTLYEAAVQEQGTVVTRRVTAEGGMEWRNRVGHLLDALRRFGAKDQAVALMNRLPAEGHFDLFLNEAGDPRAYQFGRNPDGTPAASWSWDDLD
jgi:hypothetical protein